MQRAINTVKKNLSKGIDDKTIEQSIDRIKKKFNLDEFKEKSLESIKSDDKDMKKNARKDIEHIEKRVNKIIDKLEKALKIPQEQPRKRGASRGI